MHAGRRSISPQAWQAGVVQQPSDLPYAISDRGRLSTWIRFARSDGAVPPRWEWRQWYRIVGSLDLAVHSCARISASAIDCNTLHRRKEFALGAPRRRRAFDPGTRGAMCQSDVPHSHFARAIEERSVGPESPWPLTGS